MDPHRRGRRALVRPLISFLATTAAAATLSGCIFTGGEAKSGSEIAKRGTRVTLPEVSSTLKWTGRVAPPGSTLATVSSGLGTAIGDVATIRGQLERIAGSDDPFGKALVEATCAGLTAIADQYKQDPNANVLAATSQSWATYLNQQLNASLPPQYASQISGRVAQFNNAAQLAAINPRAASTYVQACVLGRN
jgi:hypothetical protein